MAGRILGIIALIGFIIPVIGLYFISGSLNGDITNLAHCESDLMLTIVGLAITIAAGGGGAAAERWITAVRLRAVEGPRT